MKQFFRIYFIIIIVLSTGCSPIKDEQGCEKFKIGRFKIKSRVNVSYSIIERNDSVQTEINSITGQSLKAKIIWKNKCEYELYYLSQTSNSNDTIIPIIQARPLKTKIIRTTYEYCVFEAYMDSIDLRYIDTLHVLTSN